MKKTILFLCLISLLFQSCYTYKTVDLQKDKIVENKKYRLYLEGSVMEKVTVNAVSDNSITVLDKRHRLVQIPFSEIKVIKKRRLSIGKTVAFTADTFLITATTVLFIAFSNFKILK